MNTYRVIFLRDGKTDTESFTLKAISMGDAWVKALFWERGFLAGELLRVEFEGEDTE